MGYLKIPNLYKFQQILQFKQVYALEKIHGTSAHVGITDGKLRIFSGEQQAVFESLFDREALTKNFESLGPHTSVVIYGEAYGGKCQGMSHTYGGAMRFAVFDVKIDHTWLDVPNAYDVATKFGLDFVDFKLVDATLDMLNTLRDAPSVQAQKLGVAGDKKREGIVIRPPFEAILSNGERIIAKHKNDAFKEMSTERKVLDVNKLQVLKDADAIASEWVTHMRLAHVLQKLPENVGIERIRDVILAILDDIRVEGAGEIIWSKEAEKAVCSKAA